MNYISVLMLKSKSRLNFLASNRFKHTLKRNIEKILIANRGEIACRIIKTAKKLGIQTVAVYSEADKNALHVALANEAYFIGPSPPSQSYLNSKNILEVAKKSGAHAIHPGYGFLSENVEFAQSCAEENVIFIGPPPSAIRDMGIKSTAKTIMQKAGVSIIQGYHGENQTKENLKEEAKKIGFPIMIKAVRGGGGKGMRIVLEEKYFDEALESAKTESQKSFGDSVVLLEKFVTEPRHVEVQIFADSYGDAVYLYERDCSVQRRHQKIIEEAPAPLLSEDLRTELGTAAVKAAKAVGYIGAGTVEFILDRKNFNFHFMEMNTRLQVEHPITEMITGIDLVEWQIKIACGEKLPLNQEEIPLIGHAFEARIYAENPAAGFLPGAGLLEYIAVPKSGKNVRVETGVQQGDEVSVHYDPMIAKLVVWGQNREEALTKLRSNLLEYHIAGLETNINFLIDLTNHPEFQAGNVYTNFIRDFHESLFRNDNNDVSENDLIQAAISTILWDKKLIKKTFNPFYLEANFRVNYHHTRDIKLKFNEKDYTVKVKFIGKENFEISCDEGINWHNVRASLEPPNLLSCTIKDHSTKTRVFKNDDILCLFSNKGKMQFTLPELVETLLLNNEENYHVNNAVAPMPGILDKVLVKIGDNVKKGDSLFVLIAMKMEYVVKATRDANIKSVSHKVGDSLMKDEIVVEFAE